MQNLRKGRIAVYSQEEVTEIQQGFAQELKELHNNAYSIYLKYKDVPGLGKDLFKHLEIIYDKEIIIQTDINIEASTSDKTKDTSK